jgi:hypothetical protein
MPGKRWTKAEDEIIRNERQLPWPEIVALLPNRTEPAIEQRSLRFYHQRPSRKAAPLALSVGATVTWNDTCHGVVRSIDGDMAIVLEPRRLGNPLLWTLRVESLTPVPFRN